MLLGQLHPYVSKAFGIKSMIPMWNAPELNEIGEVINEVKIMSFWMAEVKYFQPRLPHDELVISSLLTSKWRKSILLIPKDAFTHISLEREPKMMPPVDISSWRDPDPVALALQNLNLYPERDTVMRSGTYMYDVGVHFATNVSFGTFRIGRGPVGNERIDNVWVAIYEVIRHVASIYNDVEINRYIYEHSY
jgi:hypothetical protein